MFTNFLAFKLLVLSYENIVGSNNFFEVLLIRENLLYSLPNNWNFEKRNAFWIGLILFVQPCDYLCQIFHFFNVFLIVIEFFTIVCISPGLMRIVTMNPALSFQVSVFVLFLYQWHHVCPDPFGHTNIMLHLDQTQGYSSAGRSLLLQVGYCANGGCLNDY